MKPEEILQLKTVPSESCLITQALWHDAHGDWKAAHSCAQDDHTHMGSWMHAYLHRKEGDIGNARYWYSQAGRPVFQGGLQEEWAAIAQALNETARD